MTVNTAVDTASYLFDYLFKCRIPNLQTMSVEYISFFGMPTTGDQGIDKELADQWITTMIPISKMVDFHNQGISIKVVRYEDVKVIYNYISLHLQAWRKQIEHGINLGDAPIDDLIALDAFANTVYDHAKHQFTRTMADSILARHMSSIVRFNKDNFFKTEAPKENTSDGITRINSEEVDPHPKRESLADIFKDRKIGARKWN